MTLRPILFVSLLHVARVAGSPSWCGTTMTGNGSFNLSPVDYSNNMVCDLTLTASLTNQVAPFPRAVPGPCQGPQ